MRISDWSSDVCSSDLGFAMKRLDGPKERLDFPDLEAGVEPLGLMGFMDPPREVAVAARAECRSAGVMVKMITGDHARQEERRVGKEWVSTCRTRWSTKHEKKNEA